MVRRRSVASFLSVPVSRVNRVAACNSDSRQNSCISKSSDERERPAFRGQSRRCSNCASLSAMSCVEDALSAERERWCVPKVSNQSFDCKSPTTLRTRTALHPNVHADVLLATKSASGPRHHVGQESFVLHRKHFPSSRSVHYSSALRRISQVEQKIDGLVASLVSTSVTRSTVESTPDSPAPGPSRATAPQSACERTLHGTWKEADHVAPGSWLPFPASFEQNPTPPERTIEQAAGEAEADREYVEKIRTVHSHTFSDGEDLGHAPESLFQPSKRREAPIENELVQQILASAQAEALLDTYRRMSTSFPFVVLPPSMSATLLYNQRPMLFLAIVLVASWQDHNRQMRLDIVYRRELAERTLISPRRTLGLVQSVLVYLSW